MKVLFLAKDHPLARAAGAYLALHAERCEAHYGDRATPRPDIDPGEMYDYVVSYLCPWIVPPPVLSRAAVAAVNFHPGPPEYPGIGCTNFAIYHGVGEYGVTCHHMDRHVDAGAIISVTRFPVYPTDTVYSLTQRSYAHLATTFYEIADLMIAGKPLPSAGAAWKRKPYRRAELDALCRITPDMSEDEVRRRIRATTYPGQRGAFIEMGGHRFTLGSP